MAGDRGAARVALERACAGGSYVSPYWLAITHLEMGDPDRAYGYLLQAFENREWFLVFLAREPALDPLRGSRRFEDLVRRVGVR